MREIKFRIFDKRVGMGFISQDDGHFYITPKGSVWDVNENVEITESAIIMQYTGLKDKNGVEIYEGDVVNVNKPWIKPRIEVVNFYTVGGMAGVHPFTDTEHQWTSYTAEVIGNVYEHPHLLEVSE